MNVLSVRKGYQPMYGTVARMRAKPGAESQLAEQMRIFEEAHVEGAVGSYIYRMDNDPTEYWLAVIFSSKEAYVANANAPSRTPATASYSRSWMGRPNGTMARLCMYPNPAN